MLPQISQQDPEPNGPLPITAVKTPRLIAEICSYIYIIRQIYGLIRQDSI
jgi:hypothetical protein